MQKLWLVSIATFLLVGCTNDQTQQQEQVPITEQTSDQGDVANNNDIATHLANIAKEVPDVDHAAAVVAGPYAVVGIDVDETLERQRVGTIKFSVNEALRDDPYGKTAIVVADADVSERLRNIQREVQEGEPIHGFIDEIAEIVGRFMPTFPVEEHHYDSEKEQGTLTPDQPQE